MGKLKSGLVFTGKVGNLVAYTLPGVEGIVVRSKGEVPRSRYRNAPEFERTRNLNAEFSGRSAASSWVMRAMRTQKPLGDYNIAGPINALLRLVQVLDTESVRGQRSVQLSRDRQVLMGFSLNKLHPFDTVVREPLYPIVSRATRSVSLTIPSLLPGINLAIPNSLPYFSLRLALGMVPDFFYAGKSGRLYEPQAGYTFPYFEHADTPWLSVRHVTEPMDFNLALPFLPPDDMFTLIVSIGIRYGTIDSRVKIEQVKHAGSAKVLVVA